MYINEDVTGCAAAVKATAPATGAVLCSLILNSTDCGNENGHVDSFGTECANSDLYLIACVDDITMVELSLVTSDCDGFKIELTSTGHARSAIK